MKQTECTDTKKKILLQAFLLFSKKPYDEVTFSDLELVTGLSRGAILYHVKTKINLFNEVIESSLFSRSSTLEIQIQEKDCLKNFILEFIHNCEVAMKTMRSYGLKNINKAHFNIESQALYYYANYAEISKQWVATEIKIWQQVIKKAIVKEEVIEVDSEAMALVFEKIYLGHAYTAITSENGCDTELLKRELFTIYELIKRK
ncbi:TetR/AcrR family transcriptional regulator [Apibacter adventoris]|uniref:TetR/AcrR family transcriptional regulator n=1 Tax=Apibacter adventoris TaxID=1679466 RepID=UPI000CF65FA2|nr:TetR family transcriptional regulator [Apibacter adventoris]PQL93750.1 hypothetical protein C4S76_08930 [Apibacter adventoris]